MQNQPDPATPAQRDEQAPPQLLPYDPPKVQSVKLSDESAESLT